MRLGLKIATKFLKSNLGQTILIVTGIAIGVSVQIFIGCLIQGLQKSLIEKTIGNSPHITITSMLDDKRISDYDNILKKIKEVDQGIEHISVADDNAAFLKYGNVSQSILVRGVEMEKANEIYHFIDGLKEGTYPKSENEIVLGVDLKKEYDISVNDKIKILTSNQKEQECKVVGFFDLKVASINKSWVFTTLDTTENLFLTNGKITSIELQVGDKSTFSADVIASEIDKKLEGMDLKVENWKKQNEQLLSGLQGQSVSSIMIQVFVLVSVVLGIASVLAITVMQKSRQIGILKAMGIKNSTASYIFLFEGLILGILGAVFGILLGLGLSFAFMKFAVNPDGTPVVSLYLSYPFILSSGLIAVVSSMLAALIPAVRSSKLNPIDIIRNN